jgi:RecA/RadA recombinase
MVREALRTARQTCRFFPSIAELRELARDIRRARFEAERAWQTQHKLLAYQADTRASGLSLAEIQARLAELLAVVSDSVRMDYDRPPKPLGRPRPLHEAYRMPTVDHAARKRLLRDQLARVCCMEEAMTSA